MRRKSLISLLIIALLICIIKPNSMLKFNAIEEDRTYKGVYVTNLTIKDPGLYCILVHVSAPNNPSGFDASVYLYRNESLYFPELDDVIYDDRSVAQASFSTSASSDFFAFFATISIPGSYTFVLDSSNLVDAKIEVNIFKFGDSKGNLTLGENNFIINEIPGFLYTFTPLESGVYKFSINQTAYEAPYAPHFIKLKATTTSSSYTYYDVYFNGKKVGRYFEPLEDYQVLINLLNDSLKELNNNITIRFYGIKESFQLTDLIASFMVKTSSDGSYDSYTSTLSVNAEINETNTKASVLSVSYTHLTLPTN